VDYLTDVDVGEDRQAALDAFVEEHPALADRWRRELTGALDDDPYRDRSLSPTPATPPPPPPTPTVQAPIPQGLR